MIVVVSDVHLGCQYSNKQEFMQFLDMCDTPDIDHIIFLGDILDFWRRNNAQVVVENSDVLEKIGHLKAKNVHYVVGNHDYYILRLSRRYSNDYFHFPVSKSLRLTDGDSRFYFIHGYELEVMANLEPLSIENYEAFCDRMCFSEDVLGEYASNLWNWFENRKGSWWKMKVIKGGPHVKEEVNRIRELAMAKGKYMLLGMHPGEKLVFGHTHEPFVSDDGMVANTGSWFNEFNKARHQNTFITIEDGQAKVRVFDGGKIV
ncbi:metallophosphoesterase [Methanocella sp. MCL-LM]|uniref:metallophosphoesterase n=1 Tax=Methanocella sp. MCL-LM TaxID=3412035 RepID=UPI003C755B87